MQTYLHVDGSGCDLAALQGGRVFKNYENAEVKDFGLIRVQSANKDSYLPSSSV